MTAPAHYLSMKLHVGRIPGSTHLLGQVTEQIVLAPGSHLHLRKVGDDYVLQIVQGKLPESKKKLQELQFANSPVSTFRKDARPSLVPNPF